MSLRVRRYRWSDLEAVCALHQICLAQVGLAPGDGVWYDDDFPRINEVYLADRGEFLVGEIGGRVAAMGGLRRIDDETAEMCRLRVHPEFQRRGHGARMVLSLEARAVELGYVRLLCDTTLNQHAAIGLYRKYGWREIRREERGGYVVLYWEKDLKDAMSVLPK
ncbi:GNAT family N-acetyltransferase [Planomonospora parontospora]|uniref:GNAT family N-acetyltransferase n=1 Tax=Planomonospora parontospora TaxID=58119 RepID=UPI00166FBE19|nr:GNAT family N-acetyltransferase [Planomonospora parontospora]GGL44093.1 GNAT family N-acetyltransferase [Planomonospora parontospora subsp. antibiotica]GII18585.1 GNAT family N-acetyltransferase [Planomonospora parontospora subsp. antibiotica]